jgi:hypothetical protein
MNIPAGSSIFISVRATFLCALLLFLCALLLTVVGLLCIGLLFLSVFLLLHLYCFTMCTAVLHTLVAALLARSQYPEGPATGHLDTGFSWFPCV